MYLRRIRFDVNNRDGCKTPAQIAGGVTLHLVSHHLSRIEGDASYKFPLGTCKPKQPGFFRIDGKGFLRDLQVADMYAQYETSGKAIFGGETELNVGPISAGFRIDDGIDTATDTYFAEGTVGVGAISDPGKPDDPNTPANEARPPQRNDLVSAGVIVSSIGLRACVSTGFGFGFHQRWGKDSAPVPDWPWEGCDGEAEDFKPAGFESGAASRSRGRVSQARGGFRVRGGVPFVNLKIEGPGGPQVVVRGPRATRSARATGSRSGSTRSSSIAS